MTIQEIIKKFQIEINGENIKCYGKPSQSEISEIKENKAEIISFILAEAKEEDAKEKATITFTVGGWESHEISVDTRFDIDEQLRKAAKYYSNDMTFESAKEAYGKAVAGKVEKEIAKKENEIKNAQRIVKEAERYTSPLMTEAEYRVWAKNYNNINNEGGEGYIPKLITVEKLASARKTLKN